MGCWNGTCFLSGLPIRSGDKIVLTPIVQISEDFGIQTYCDKIFALSGIFIRGEYNDYGGIEHIVDNHGAKSLLQIFQTKDRFLQKAEQYDEVVEWTNLESIVNDGLSRDNVFYKPELYSQHHNKDSRVSFIMMYESIFDEVVLRNTENMKASDFVGEEMREIIRVPRDVLGMSNISRWPFISLGSSGMTDREVVELLSFYNFCEGTRKLIFPSSGAGSQSEVDDD